MRSWTARSPRACSDGAWAESAALLQSIPGIGPGTAAWLLVATMNFALCATPEAAVAYVGLNPLERQSGTSVRGRPALGRGGHKRVRKALYMASLSAARHNPLTQPLYTRLRAKGKSSKLAHCAVARKLLHVAWAVVTKRPPVRSSVRAIQRTADRSRACVRRKPARAGWLKAWTASGTASCGAHGVGAAGLRRRQARAGGAHQLCGSGEPSCGA